MRRNFMLDVVFGNCEGLFDPIGMQSLGDNLAFQGFDMIVFPTLGDERIVLKESEIGSYLMQTWAKRFEQRQTGLVSIRPFVRQLLAQGLEQFQWQFSTAYTDDHIDVILGGLVDFEFRESTRMARAFCSTVQLAIRAISEDTATPGVSG